MTNAVMVQSTTVSQNTSKMPKHPWWCGLLTFAQACADGEVPSPASFENMPRVTPNRTARAMVQPVMPPPTLLSENAPFIISDMTDGSLSALTRITHSETPM